MRLLSTAGTYLDDKHRRWSHLQRTAGMVIAKAELLTTDSDEYSIKHLESFVFPRMMVGDRFATYDEVMAAGRRLRAFLQEIIPADSEAAQELESEALELSFWPDGDLKGQLKITVIEH